MTSPFITVLSTTSTAGPNWTYTSAPPSQAHTAPNPTLAARRARNTTTTSSSHATSAASETKLTRYLLDLERDNFKDVSIPVPGAAAKKKEVLGRAQKGRKPTANVRRVLASQKGWANYVADEEALGVGAKVLGIGQGHGPAAGHGAANSGAASKARRGSTVSAVGEEDNHAVEETEEDTMDLDTPKPTQRRKSSAATTHPRPHLPDADGGPPLGYSKAVAGASKRPRQWFCEICGYWGQYRCMRCGARYCGSECGAVHTETRCLKFYG